jgi:hypothetical protein
MFLFFFKFKIKTSTRMTRLRAEALQRAGTDLTDKIGLNKKLWVLNLKSLIRLYPYNPSDP